MKTMKTKRQRCHNCNHASQSFKIAGKTHYQCYHAKHNAGIESGKLSAWDTLREFWETCEDHELKALTK